MGAGEEVEGSVRYRVVVLVLVLRERKFGLCGVCVCVCVCEVCCVRGLDCLMIASFLRKIPEGTRSRRVRVGGGPLSRWGPPGLRAVGEGFLRLQDPISRCGNKTTQCQAVEETPEDERGVGELAVHYWSLTQIQALREIYTYIFSHGLTASWLTISNFEISSLLPCSLLLICKLKAGRLTVEHGRVFSGYPCGRSIRFDSTRTILLPTLVIPIQHVNSKT